MPNLTNKFVIGSSANTGSKVTGSTLREGGSKDIELIGHNHQISAIVDHTHAVEVAQSNADHDHEHTHPDSTVSVQVGTEPAATVTFSGGSTEDGNHNHNYDKGARSERPSNTGEPNTNDGYQGTETGGAGKHSHQFSGSVTVPSHDHTVTSSIQIAVEQISAKAVHAHQASSQTAGGHDHGGDTANAGVSGNTGVNKNLPPYYALYYIMRII